MDIEQERHSCEVRWCISRGRGWFDSYVKDVAKIRGRDAAMRLIRDVKEQASLGNGGEPGDWRLRSMAEADGGHAQP